ncbi:hypothetical protein ACHHYP_20650 [Achlya hypogyna]|uniref:Uncharacterized protein n=1 Tax=Achlya hypogyna TaxID=1202772 RepID=A0A1V9ZGD3_ACHHY|nr:hypothetical protein ACHHYP_20650 [Achlya hypogyna]
MNEAMKDATKRRNEVNRLLILCAAQKALSIRYQIAESSSNKYCVFRQEDMLSHWLVDLENL